jgi:hypothetical protein
MKRHWVNNSEINKQYGVTNREMNKKKQHRVTNFDINKVAVSH